MVTRGVSLLSYYFEFMEKDLPICNGIGPDTNHLEVIQQEMQFILFELCEQHFTRRTCMDRRRHSLSGSVFDIFQALQLLQADPFHPYPDVKNHRLSAQVPQAPHFFNGAHDEILMGNDGFRRQIQDERSQEIAVCQGVLNGKTRFFKRFQETVNRAFAQPYSFGDIADPVQSV
jgi:hypothetical protein